MLEQRLIAEEMMDADDLDEATYIAVVHDLARVNALTLAYRPTIQFMRRLVRHREADRPLRILDVGFGDGDMLRRIARWAAKRNIAVDLVGIDLNPRSLAAVKERTTDAMGIDYRIGDYASLAGEGWDAIISNLVAHHMSHDQLIAFLRFMQAEARLGWLVNDLHRHGFAHTVYPPMARLFGCHPIVQHDGKMSIARSYRPQEWPDILREAGVADARVHRVFPFRLCVESWPCRSR
ncbi:MAG: methyltransferase domain-containing protein [Pontixanthobacter sp.]